VKLDSVGEGCDMVGGGRRRPKVSEDMVITIAAFRLRVGDRARTTHEGLARSRKMWTLNADGDRSPEEVRWLWKIEWKEPFSAGEDREAASGSDSSSMSKKRDLR
jgi:hypothetical protein